MTTRATKPTPRFVDLLREASAEGLRLSTTRAPLEPINLRRAAADVAKQLGDLAPRTPPTFELEALERSLRKGWRSRGALEDLPPTELRRAPWVFFFPRAKPERWLATDKGFIDAWLLWFAANRRSRVVVALLREFIATYPQASSVFEDLRRTLVREVRIGRSVRLQRWQERSETFGLLERNGPTLFLQRWSKGDASFEQCMQEAGLSPGLESSAFVEQATDRLLELAGQQLGRGRADPAWLERVFAWLGDDNRLRFENLRVRTARTLLEPFVDLAPPAEVQEAIRAFLCRSIGDPRIQRSRWQGVPDEVRNVLFRWMVSASLEDFFRVLDATALDRHWLYRKAFWWAFYKPDYISDAWVVLGPEAARLARKDLDVEGAGAASLRRRDGVQANHSVLLMRIANLTIAEWSHNGKCRIWLDGNKSAPKLYEPEYSRRQLTEGCDWDQVHGGAHDGTWQSKVARYVADNTGIRMSRGDYMPKVKRGGYTER